MNTYTQTDIELAALAHNCTEEEAVSLGYVDQLIQARNEHRLSYDKLAYKRNRRNEYPPIEDYLDGVVKGDQAQIQAYIDACNAIKAKYPKQE